MHPTARSVRFDGTLLRRGFWLYAWKIVAGSRTVFYVGRTGDSSSNNAASPFNRIGTHLDARPNAKANSLTRRLLETGLKPEECQFHMAAVGPLFPEQADFAAHCPVRDLMASLEHRVASHFRDRGYEVLGVHTATGTVNHELAAHVIQELESALNASDA